MISKRNIIHPHSNKTFLRQCKIFLLNVNSQLLISNFQFSSSNSGFISIEENVSFLRSFENHYPEALTNRIEEHVLHAIVRNNQCEIRE